VLDRIAATLLRRRLDDYPAVALVGPRQCGKTTLARSLPGRYFDLEDEGDKLRLDLEWPDVTRAAKLLILDEAQTAPEIFRRMRGAIDTARQHNGRFLILGSVSPQLMVQVSESLAGRLSVIELSPLLLGELESEVQRRRHWLTGGYPDGGVLRPSRYPTWQDDYLSLLIQRDLPLWGLPAKPQVTRRLARMLAAVHGQTWNASKLGQSLGLNYQTVSSYVDYLEGAFLVRRLAPFHANLKKRLVKSPKVYWRDSGILHSLMNVESREALLRQPWVGASWEGYVVEQVLGVLAATGRRFESFHLRTSDQYEIDLVLDYGEHRWAVEIKLTSQPTTEDIARLNKAADLIDASRRVMVSHTPETIETSAVLSCDLPTLLDRLQRA